MKNLTRQNPRQLIVAQELINKVKSKCCGIKAYLILARHPKVYTPYTLRCRRPLFMHQYLQDAPVDVRRVRVEGGGLQGRIIRLRLEDLLQFTPIPLLFPHQIILNVLLIQALLDFNLCVCRIGSNHTQKLIIHIQRSNKIVIGSLFFLLGPECRIILRII